MTVTIENLREEHFDAIQELDTNLWLCLHFNGDYSHENAFCAISDGRLAGVGCLSFECGWYAMERTDIPHKLMCHIAVEENRGDVDEVKGLLMDALTVRARAYKTVYPDREICMSTYLETGAIDDMRFFMRKGFGFYGVSPVLAYDLTRDIPHYPLPGGIKIAEYEFTRESMAKYLDADREASGHSASEAEMWFNKEGPGFKCFCAMSGEKVAGSVVVWDISETRSATENIFVVPEFRRKNIARETISTALEFLKKRGKKIATLSMDGTNKNAMRLYLSCGYELYYNLLEMRYVV